MAVFDDLMDAQRRTAYAVRQRLLESRGADEIIAWLSEGADSALYDASMLRDAYAQRAEELSATAADELLRATALSEFDQRWYEQLALLREMYRKIPHGNKRAVTKVAEPFKRTAYAGLAGLLADVKAATVRVLAGMGPELSPLLRLERRSCDRETAAGRLVASDRLRVRPVQDQGGCIART